MKKTLVVAVFLVAFAGLAPLAHAAASSGTTNWCSKGDINGGNGYCYTVTSTATTRDGEIQCPSGTANAGDGECHNTTTGAIVQPGGTPANTVSPAPVSGFVPLATIPGLTDSQSLGSVVNSTSLADFLNNLYRYLVGLAGILAVIEIIRGGLEISTKDSVSKKTDGKKRIYQALSGLALTLSPYVVFSIINPSILNLSLNLPAIKPMTVNSSADPNANAVVSTKTLTNGCTVKGNSYFETITCTDQNALGQADCGYANLKLETATYESGQASYQAYCTGSDSTRMYYMYYLIGHIPLTLSDPQPVPSQQTQANAYVTDCKAGGGMISYVDNINTDVVPGVEEVIKNTHITSSSGYLTYDAALAAAQVQQVNASKYSCSSYGVPSTPSNASGAFCFGNTMQCVPPSSS